MKNFQFLFILLTNTPINNNILVIYRLSTPKWLNISIITKSLVSLYTVFIKTLKTIAVKRLNVGANDKDWSTTQRPDKDWCIYKTIKQLTVKSLYLTSFCTNFVTSLFFSKLKSIYTQNLDNG